MLTQLATVKARLDITVTTYDTLLTNAIRAISTRFDQECNRTFARTAGATEEFDGDGTEIRVAAYPIETVTKFELKITEREGWVEQTDVDYLIRRNCVISLCNRLSNGTSAPSALPLARVTYTGGYVLPGATPGAGQTPLPDDLEQATVEQVACWFLHRDSIGLSRSWPHDGTYEQFIRGDLLDSVRAVLARYERATI